MIDAVIPTRDLRRASGAIRSLDGLVGSVTLVMRPEWGFTRQVDDGWRATSAPLVLFLNDDCQVNRDALWAMTAIMANPEVGMVGPTLPCGDFQSDRRNAPRKDGEAPLYLQVRHLIGACLLVRRETLERIGGWDTEFILHCSDLDLCIRAQDAGYRAVWAVGAEVGHESRATINEMPDDERKRLVAHDHWLFVRKHPQEPLSKTHGVKALMALPKGNRAIYPHLTAAQPAA